MKLNIFFVRSMSIIMMLVLTAVSLILGLVMFCISTAVTGQNFYFPWLLFGDILIPLALFIPAIVYRNRYCALAAIVTSFINIFMRLVTIIIFNETLMPLDYYSVRLLLEHTDMSALKAILGSTFYLWAIPLFLVTLGMVTYCCVVTWKTVDKTSHAISRNSLKIFYILLGLSLLSNTAFQIIRFCTSPDNYLAVRPLPLIVVNLTQRSFSGLYNSKVYTPLPIPESSRKILEGMKLLPPQGSEEIPKKAVFDKIIIIAVESLDYDFIGCTNPEMPEGITPNLDRFSSEYFSMSNYYAASQPTSWGLASLLLSRLDYDRDRYINPTSLYSIAREQGYKSFYFSAASGNFGDNRRIYLQLFKPDKSMFREEWQQKYPIRHTSQWGLSDNDLYKCVLQELEAGKHRKFIAVISTVDTHPPCFVHDELTEADKARFPSVFLQSLHNTDREIGKFIRALMDDPDFYDDKTLIIITADHTATFGENYLKRTDFTPDRIPLIFICRNQKLFAKLNPEKFASSIDLTPTLAGMIGATAPESFMGRDLFSDKNCAITRIFGDTLILYSPEGVWSTPTATCDENNLRHKAVCDFFYFHYGKPE